MQRLLSTLILMACASGAGAVTNQEDWGGEAELGVLITSGNTEETNINTRVALVNDVPGWRNQLKLASLYSKADGETTSEEYRASAQTDYKFSERQFWFLRGSYEDDRFSGYDFESSLTSGYGHRLWQQGERSFLELSAGGGYRFNRFDEPDDTGEREEKEAIARLSGRLDYSLSETALVRQTLSTEVGLDDGNTVSESETSLQAAINGSLSMKLAFRLKHLSEPPGDSENVDTETAVSLLYGF
ncbi:MAG: DUF481 domain-containing protein [Pseudomonadales bacterium]|uniref:DUF481 domain-containing protein n=1 Tax=Marinobacter xestospongiae TaxID=994319 RepID=UPI002002CD4D|nr:DUF481 domain-containing protein [Marinobacter xestospongiae]MCG8519902.1 DUF481 domain-containing protein [Pseudomonadales bacterium]MCK7565304.1 DUF481 domain-containing protein [Marinobacter xestospongiae]